jgi:hypothetical protein
MLIWPPDLKSEEARAVQANIMSVTVQGRAQDRDADLDHLQQFEVETDTGHRYVVTCEGPPVGSPSDWKVTSADDRHLVGSVRLLGAGMPGATNYRYKRAGALLAGGKQFDLWNAVMAPAGRAYNQRSATSRSS